MLHSSYSENRNKALKKNYKREWKFTVSTCVSQTVYRKTGKEEKMLPCLDVIVSWYYNLVQRFFVCFFHILNVPINYGLFLGSTAVWFETVWIHWLFSFPSRCRKQCNNTTDKECRGRQITAPQTNVSKLRADFISDQACKEGKIKCKDWKNERKWFWLLLSLSHIRISPEAKK